MTDFVISEEQLNLALDDMFEFCRSGELKKVRSTPLSAELKKERERVLDKYLELLVSCRFELDGEIVVKMSAIRNVREELRGEP